MASRTASEDWQFRAAGTPPTARRCARPAAHQPRDERVLLPQSLGRRALRPKPLNIPARVPLGNERKVLLESEKENVGWKHDQPCDPAIQDSATLDMLRQYQPFLDAQDSGYPSDQPRNSLRHSALSYGMLDYYISGPTPSNSPKSSPPFQATMPHVDPAIEQFDFGLSPVKSKTKAVAQQIPTHVICPAEEKSLPSTPASPPATPSQRIQKKPYGLFPTIPDAALKITTIELQDLPQSPVQANPPADESTPTPRHRQPDPSYRPRKESLSSSIRSRKDSLGSYRTPRRTALRIFSGSTISGPKSCTSTTISTAGVLSPLEPFSRWSDETATPPSAAPTPGTRTSFGSLLNGRDSAQYPTCSFFDDDDDDERVPLKDRLFGKRSTSSTSSYEQQQRQPQLQHRQRQRKSSEGSGFTQVFAKVILCGACFKGEK